MGIIDAFDRICEFGAMFDWITPLVTFGHNIAVGDSYQFHVPDGYGWSGLDVQRLLERSHIDTWGHMVVRGDILITVRRRDAARAQHVMDSAGVPVLNPKR